MNKFEKRIIGIDVNLKEENITIVQKLYNAFSDRDVNKLLELLCDDVEWGEPENPYNPSGGTRRGHEGFMEWINIGRHAEEILELKINKCLANDDTVAVIGHMKCKAIVTGKEYESDFVHLVELEERKVKKIREYFDTYIAGEAFRP